jgi:hypothetical protein
VQPQEAGITVLQMTYDKTTKLWSVTATLTGAEFKFRANNNWDI